MVDFGSRELEIHPGKLVLHLALREIPEDPGQKCNHGVNPGKFVPGW